VLEEGSAPVASLWGTERRTSAANAVLVNSTAGHAFEMDDIHKESVIHPNSLAVPIVLALAETDRTLTGQDVVTAMVVGYEVGLRVGNAATTSLFLNGFHPQGTSGAFVAAATAGRLLKLRPSEMQNALGIAGSMGAGLMAAQEGAMVKRLHSGRAAQGGVIAAQLARKGFTGISDVIEAGYGGFLSSFSRAPNVARLTDGIGSDWEAGKVGFKMYPNVTSIHAALDALKSILSDHRLDSTQISEIDVRCGHMTFVHTAWDYKPTSITAAQMNMYYGLAVVAVRGDLSASDYTDAAISDQAILSFIPRIRISVDQDLESKGPALRHAAKVLVRTGDGREFSRDILHRRGSPECPVSGTDIERKFDSNVAPLLEQFDIKQLKDLSAKLELLPDFSGIIEIVAAPFKSRQATVSHAVAVEAR